MGLNEWLFCGEAILCAGLVISIWKLDKERLLGFIAIALILVTTVGGKIIVIFGYETNAGNLFYASVFLATYLLIERYGKKEGARALWWGTFAVAAFLALAELSVAFAGTESTAAFDGALYAVFVRAPRVALASLSAYVLAQGLNIFVFTYLKRRFNGGRLWLRINIAHVLAQALDSLVFFTIAFVGVVEPPHVLTLLITGFVIKTAFVAITSPILYLNRVELEEDGAVASISVRYGSLAA